MQHSSQTCLEACRSLSEIDAATKQCNRQPAGMCGKGLSTLQFRQRSLHQVHVVWAEGDLRGEDLN